jgi:hypothetical protein
MARTQGSYMIQPTKDELWLNNWEMKKTISTLKSELAVEKLSHAATQQKLEIATRKVGELVINQEMEKELANSELTVQPEQAREPQIERRFG